VISQTPPNIECEMTRACLAVSDLAAAIEFYVTKLGFGSDLRLGSRRRLRVSGWGRWGFF
jgi:hypothetical protein